MVVDIVMGVAVHLVFGFRLASYHHPAGAVENSTKGLGLVFGLVVWSASAAQDLLHLIKHMLSYHWLVFALVEFTTITEVAIIEWVGEDKRDSVSVESLAVPGGYSLLRQKGGDILQPTPTLGVQLVGLANSQTLFPIYHHSLSPYVVKITYWRNSWVLAKAHFLAQPATSILGKRVHIVFALTKGDIEHELSLWRWLKPKGWELQRHNTPNIEEIDNLSAIHTISSQTIGIPRNYPIYRTFFDIIQHLVKEWTAWCFCTLFLHYLLDNRQTLYLGIIPQLG